MIRRPAAFLAAGAALGWLVPGLGHVALGLPRRAAAFFAIVTVTFAVGLLLGGSLQHPDPGHPLTYLGAFTTSGTGVLKLYARWRGLGEGDLRAPTYEYGTTYLLVAGIMNLLLVLDVLERGSGHR